MAERKALFERCKELGIPVTGKTRINIMRAKLKELGAENLQPANRQSPGSESSGTNTNVVLSENQIAVIVDSVVTKLAKKSRNGKRSHNKSSISNTTETESSDESSSDEETDAESDDRTSSVVPARRRKKKSDRSGKIQFISKPSLALSYSIPESVKKSIVDGKSVSLYKLLPGFSSNSSSEVSTITDSDGIVKFKVGESSKEKKLARQKLDFPQMLMALLKLKDVYFSLNMVSRVGEIDNYIKNLTMICNKYSGSAYWSYHLYFWDKAAEFSERGVPLDWSVIDSEALHAAIAQNSATNFCDRCQSWYHGSELCPFNLLQLQDRQALVSSPAGNYTDRSKCYYKGKEICNRFNFGTCSQPKCSYLHMCKFCNKFDHSVRSCPSKKER